MYQFDFLIVLFCFGFYLVVDSVVWIECLLEVGVCMIQLCIKDKCNEEVEVDVIVVIVLGCCYDVCLFINDYWCLVIKYCVYGVYLGQEDFEIIDLKVIQVVGLCLGVLIYDDMEIDVVLVVKFFYIVFGYVFLM